MRVKRLSGNAAMMARGWIPKQVLIDKQTARLLRHHAKRSNRTVAGYIRHAIAEQMGRDAAFRQRFGGRRASG